MARFGVCKECFFDIPLDDSSSIGTRLPGTGSNALYECPDCYYPNSWYDFHGVYDITEMCTCGHLVAAHPAGKKCTLCECKEAGYANIQ
jgi:hypothetical protein